MHEYNMHAYRGHTKLLPRLIVQCKPLFCIQDRVNPTDETGHTSKPTSTKHILQLPAMDSF